MLNVWKKVPNYLHGSFYLFIFASSNNEVQSLKSVYYVLVSIIPRSWMCYWICTCPLAHRSHWTYPRHYRILLLSSQKSILTHFISSDRQFVTVDNKMRQNQQKQSNMECYKTIIFRYSSRIHSNKVQSL